MASVESYQYPNGHINHLEKEQQTILEEFKVICDKEGYYTPLSEDQKASHDDETLLYVMAHNACVRLALNKRGRLISSCLTLTDDI